MKKRIVFTSVFICLLLILSFVAFDYISNKLLAQANLSVLDSLVEQEKKLLTNIASEYGQMDIEDRLRYIEIKKKTDLDDMEILDFLLEQYDFLGGIACKAELPQKTLKDIVRILRLNETLIWEYTEFQNGDIMKPYILKNDRLETVYLPDNLLDYSDVEKKLFEDFPNNHSGKSIARSELEKYSDNAKPTLIKWHEGSGNVVKYLTDSSMDEFLDEAIDYYSEIGYEKLDYDLCNPFKDCNIISGNTSNKVVYFKGMNNDVVCVRLVPTKILSVSIIVTDNVKHLVGTEGIRDGVGIISLRKQQGG